MITESQIDLTTLAKIFVANKREMDSYKKICDEESKQLKTRMDAENVQEIPIDDKKALRRIVTTSYDVNEAKMIQVLKKYGINATKTVEVIDEDALEKFLYNADPEENKELLGELDRCKSTKEVVSLRIVNAKNMED